MSEFGIRIAKEPDYPLWDAYVLKHPKGLGYQLSGWKRAVESAYGFKTVYLIAQTRYSVVGVLPLAVVGLPLRPPAFVSLPYCDAGGPLADNEEIEQELILHAAGLAKASGSKTVEIRSAGAMAGLNPEKTVNRQKVRMILDLPRTSAELLSSLKAKVRSQVKKARKHGLTAVTGSTDILDDFYTVFTENMRDLGSPVHSRKWIRSILRYYENRAHLGVVYLSCGVPAAAGLIICHPHLVSIPWASSLRRYNRKNPNMMLYWQFLKFSTDHHFPAFDFGRSTPGEGTFRFKKQWGAVPEDLHWTDFRVSAMDGGLVPLDRQMIGNSSRARNVAEQVLMNLPVTASTAIGRLTRKYITL